MVSLFMVNFVRIIKRTELMNEILERKVLIGENGITIQELLKDKQMVLVPIDKTSLEAEVVEGDRRTWRHFLGDNPAPDLFFAEIPVKRMTLKASAVSGNRILLYAPECASMILKNDENPKIVKTEVKKKETTEEKKEEKKEKKEEKEEKEKKEIKTTPTANPQKSKFVYFMGSRINLYEREELEKKSEVELIRQRDYLMRQLDFNVIATDTNIWLADEDCNGKKQMKYKHMLLFLGQTQREKAIKPDDDYTFNDYRFEVHNAVYSEINSFSKDMEDPRQPMAWSAKCLISDMCKKEGKQLKARLELVVEEAEDDKNKIYADKWIRQYSKNIMIEERLRLLVITNDRDLQIRVNNDCNRDWTDYNKKPENKDKRIKHDLIPVTERGDIIMNITEQIQLIDSVLQERCHNIDNRKKTEKRTY